MKSKHAVEDDRESVLEVVAPKEEVVLVPDPADDREGDGERRKADEDALEIGEAFWDFERDDQECQCEAEDGVAESLDRAQTSSVRSRAPAPVTRTRARVLRPPAGARTRAPHLHLSAPGAAP